MSLRECTLIYTELHASGLLCGREPDVLDFREAATTFHLHHYTMSLFRCKGQVPWIGQLTETRMLTMLRRITETDILEFLFLLSSPQ
jgi:hypothetical protein